MTDPRGDAYERPRDYWCNDDAQVRIIEAALDCYEASLRAAPPASDTERRAIEAIRRHCPERVVSSPEGYALTVGRLCELALRAAPPSSERAVREAWIHAYTSLGCDRANAEKMVAAEIAAAPSPSSQEHNAAGQEETPPRLVQSESEQRDWPEDFAHENGRYSCRCCECGEVFTGHKRRVICKRCSQGQQPAHTDHQLRHWGQDVPGVHSRGPAARSADADQSGQDEMLKDADILITGGTGSFGRALVRRLLQLEEPPKRIIVFSRDELKQHEMAIEHRAQWARLRFFLGDVRDEARLRTAFHGVDYVIHAAAMKQVPACEYNPTEAIATNVGGAKAVVSAAIDTGVKRVLALSTDKAVNPVNLYGATKLCAEKLFTSANNLAGAQDTRFACVRYGNVLGSRGSVLQVWREQLAAGRKLTLTHPQMSRFWITLTEAVQFVLLQLAAMRGAEVFIPKLPSCRMIELADALAGPGTDYERIPVRQGEKMHETLIGEDEAQDTWEFQRHYEITRMQVDLSGRRLEAGFVYRSDTNRQRFNHNELTMLLQEIP